MDPQPLSPRPRRWQASSPADESLNIVDNLLSPVKSSSAYLSAPSSPTPHSRSGSDRSLSPLAPPLPGRFDVSLKAGKTVMPPIAGFGRPLGPRRSIRGARIQSGTGEEGLRRNESIITSGTSASQDQAFQDVLSTLDILSSAQSSASLSSLVNPQIETASRIRTPSPNPTRSTLSATSHTPTRSNSQILNGPRTPNRSLGSSANTAVPQPQSTPSRAANLIALFEKKSGESPSAAPVTKSFTGHQASPVKAGNGGLSSAPASGEKPASDESRPRFTAADPFTLSPPSVAEPKLDKGKGRAGEPFRTATVYDTATSSPAASLLQSFPAVPSSVPEPSFVPSSRLSPIPASATSVASPSMLDTPPPVPIAKDPTPSLANAYRLPAPAAPVYKPAASPLSSVRTMVAAWRNRTSGPGNSPERNRILGARGRGRNALGDGFLSIRRKNGRFGDRQNSPQDGPESTNEPPSQLLGESPSAPGVTAGNETVPPERDVPRPPPNPRPSGTSRERATSQTLSISGDPLRTGTLYYLNVHDMTTAPNYKWIRADARLFPSVLSLSWMTASGGRAVVVLDLQWCQEVRSIPSPNHPSARSDIGSVAARNQELAESLYPFQMVYDDGLERLGCESARDRVRWVGAVWDALERVPAPGRSSSLFQNRSEQASSDGGSASTSYNNPLIDHRLSRADSLLLTSQPVVQSHGTSADDAVIATSGGLTAPIAQRGSRRLAARGLDRQRSLRRVASEADIEPAGTELLQDPHRHTVHPTVIEPSPLTADFARTRPASRDFTFAGGVPPPQLLAPFTVMQRTSPSDYYALPVDNSPAGAAGTSIFATEASTPGQSMQTGPPPPQSSSGYETARSEATLRTFVTAPQPFSDFATAATDASGQKAHLSPSSGPQGTFNFQSTTVSTSQSFITELTARPPPTESQYMTATTYQSTIRNAALPVNEIRPGRASPKMPRTRSSEEVSYRTAREPHFAGEKTLLPGAVAPRKPADAAPRPVSTYHTANGYSSDEGVVTAPVGSTLSRSVATARARPSSAFVTAPARTSFYDASADASVEGGIKRWSNSSYATAPPPPISHTTASSVSLVDTGVLTASEMSWETVQPQSDSSRNEEWENATQISDPESDNELLELLERQSSTGSKLLSERTARESLYQTAHTIESFQTPQAPSSGPSQYTTAHTGSCTTKYVTASTCSCQETRSQASSISRPTDMPSLSSGGSVGSPLKPPVSPSTAKSTKASTPGRLRRIPVPTVNSVPTPVLGDTNENRTIASVHETAPTESVEDPPHAEGSIISHDVNKVLNYLQGQEQSRRGQAARMSDQLNRIEHNVYGISQAFSNRDVAPPVPTKDGGSPPSPFGSPPSTPSSSSSSSTARPVTPPSPVSDAVARELDDMRSMLGTLLGRTNDILDAQLKARKSESSTRGPTLHRIEDLLRRLLVRSGDSEIADEMGYEPEDRHFPPAPPSLRQQKSEINPSEYTDASSFKGGSGSIYSDQVLRRAPAPPGSFTSAYDREGRMTPVADSLLDGELPGIDFDEDFELRNLPPSTPPREKPVKGTGIPIGIHNIRRKMPPMEEPADLRTNHDWLEESPYQPAPPRPQQGQEPHIPSPIMEEPREVVHPTPYYDESPESDEYQTRHDTGHRRRMHPSPPTPQPVHVPSPVGPGYGPSTGFGPPPPMRPPFMRPPIGMNVPRMNVPRIASSRDPITTTYFRRGFPPPGPGMGMGMSGMGMFPGPMGMTGPGMGPFMHGLRPGFGGPIGPNVNPALRRPGFFPPGVPGASGDYGLPRDAGHLSRVGDPLLRADLPDSGLGLSGTSTSTTTTPTATTTTPIGQLVTPSDPPRHVHSASDATRVTDDSFKRALGNSQALAEAQGEQQNEISRYLHGVSDQIEAGRKQQHEELAGILRDINDLRSQINPPQHVQGHVQLDGTVQLDTGEIVDGVHGEPMAMPAIPVTPAVAVTVAPAPSVHTHSAHSSHVRGAVLPDGTVIADGKIVDGVHGTNLLPSSPLISDGQLKDIEQDIKLGQLQDRVSELMQRTTPRSANGLPGSSAPPMTSPSTVAGPPVTIAPPDTLIPPVTVAVDGLVEETSRVPRPMGNYTDVVRERTVQKEREVIREGPGYHHKEVDREDIHSKDHEHDDLARLGLPSGQINATATSNLPLDGLASPVRINPHTGRPLTTPSLLGGGGPLSVVPPSVAGEPHLVREIIEEIRQIGPGAPTHTKVTQEYTTDPNAPTLAPTVAGAPSQLGNLGTRPTTNASNGPAHEITEVVEEILRPNAAGQPKIVRTSELVQEIDPQRPPASVVPLPPTVAANVPASAVKSATAPAASAATAAPPAPPPALVPSSLDNLPSARVPTALPPAPAATSKPVFSTNHPKPELVSANVPVTTPAAVPTQPVAVTPSAGIAPASTPANVPTAPPAAISNQPAVPALLPAAQSAPIIAPTSSPAVSPKPGKRFHYQPLMPYKPVANVTSRPSQPPSQPPVQSIANVPNVPPASAPTSVPTPSSQGASPASGGAVLTATPNYESSKDANTTPGMLTKPSTGAPKIVASGAVPPTMASGHSDVPMEQLTPPIAPEVSAAGKILSKQSSNVPKASSQSTVPPARPDVKWPESAAPAQRETVATGDTSTQGKPSKEVHFAPSRPPSLVDAPPFVTNLPASGSGVISQPVVPQQPRVELEEVILPDGRTAYIKKSPPEMMEEEEITLPDGRRATVPRQPRPKAKLTKLPNLPSAIPAAPIAAKTSPLAPSMAPVSNVAPSARPPPPPEPISLPGTSASNGVPSSIVIDKPGPHSSRLSKKPSKVSMADVSEVIPDAMVLGPAAASNQDNTLGSTTLPQVPSKTASDKSKSIPSVAPDPEAVLAEQKRLANVAKANAEKAAAETAERVRIQQVKADKAKLMADRHQANADALADLRKALESQVGADKTWRSAYDESTKTKEKRRADKVTRDKKWQDALDKLLADKEEMKKHRDANDKKPGSQAILDALKTAGDQQSAFLRKMAAEIMDHNSNQHKLTQTEAQKWAREQVGFNLAGYLDDFSKALSGEVRTLLKEVGDLRESRRALQYELAELLLMKGRQSGGDLMAVMPYPTQPPKPAKPEKKEEAKKDNKAPPKAPVPHPMWAPWGQPFPPAGLQVNGPARPLPYPGLVPGPPPAAPAQPAGSRPLPAV